MEFIKYIPGILIVLVAVAFISIIWVNSITNDCSDYKDKDLLDEDDKIQIG